MLAHSPRSMHACMHELATGDICVMWEEESPVANHIKPVSVRSAWSRLESGYKRTRARRGSAKDKHGDVECDGWPPRCLST